MAQVFVAVVDILGDFEVSLASFGAGIVVGMPHPQQLELVDQGVWLVAQSGPQAVILTVIDLPCERQHSELLDKIQLTVGVFAELIPVRHLLPLTQAPAVSGLVLGLIEEVASPGRDWLANDLSPLAIQEGEHVEIAITLG